MILAILAGIIPAGIVLHARLARALEDRARADLELAPRILTDRTATMSDALMMHAKEFAHESALVQALLTLDRAAIDRIANAQSGVVPGAIPVVVGPAGESLSGPIPDSSSIGATRSGKMPVATEADALSVRTVALAPVLADGRWLGAAGFAIPFTDEVAQSLASLTQSDVIIVAVSGPRPVATTLDTALTRAIVERLGSRASTEPVDLRAGSDRIAVVTAPLNGAAYVAFARMMQRELAILPALRQVALLSTVGALVLALFLGTLLAAQVARPVRDLAIAARALGSGDFEAPLPRSRIGEVTTVANTFAAMRQALAARLAELQAANRELEDRAVRLAALQNDLLQRERLAASGLLIGHLAHEIRNPVATMRNLLEVIRRRLDSDSEGREYADLAIDELLRMHELAERMLDLNRPRDPAHKSARVGQIARDVARLITVGQNGIDARTNEIIVQGETEAMAAIAPDALKQVLINLVQNALEADHARPGSARVPIELSVRQHGSTVSILVRDHGSGIPAANLTRIFDPFFTTKDTVHGVGLGLFVAEGIVRAAGGRLTARNHENGGAEFRVELPAADAPQSAELERPAVDAV